MSKCKHKPVCGASDLLTRTRNGKKMVVIGWRPRAFIPFSSTRGKGTLNWRVSKAQRGTAHASKRGSPEYGSLYIHRTEPASIWSLVWWLFKWCPESLSRRSRDVREEKQGYEYGIAHPVYTSLIFKWWVRPGGRSRDTWEISFAELLSGISFVDCFR